MFRKFISEYLSFTRKERIGVVVILGLIVLLAILPLFYRYLIPQKKYDHTAFQKEIAALKIRQADNGDEPRYYKEGNYRTYPSYNRKDEGSSVKGELFYFDPNTLDADGWKRLGVREKTVSTIQKYISKGGKFRQPDDIKKIWGLHEDEAERLIPYVSIKGTSNEKVVNDRKPFEKKEHTIVAFDINSADTTAFIALPGIGNKLANRIVGFREKLGGFYKVEQIGETYGLSDSVFQNLRRYFVIHQPNIHQLNINTATIDEMKQHPYIRYALANAVVQYRNQHGKYSSLNDLKKIVLVTDEVYGKVTPYLTY
ncbi:MAG TPA: helix-hairpin-helix domain-containing protein [Ferruginibacter sp.]|nr:helix-hairpin-helix domain-containing protein [Ferruginibacter sp.]